MAVTNFVSNRLVSKKLVSNRTFAYEGVVDYVGSRMNGMYIDNKTYAYDNVTCLSSTAPSSICCGVIPPYDTPDTCGTWYYLQLEKGTPKAVPSSSFQQSPTGGYYDVSTKKGFRTLGFCGPSIWTDVSDRYYPCAANCSGNADEGYIRNNGGNGLGFNAVAGIKAHDGSLWTWGNNTYGQLGNGGLGGSLLVYSPVQISSESWKMVRGAGYHFAAIRQDGTLWTWGRNDFGQLGHNNSTHTSHPGQVAGSWKFVTVGAFNTFGIRSDDTLWGWGINSNGGLGDGTSSDRSSPVQISGGGSWKFVMSDGSHENASCGIKTDGRAYAWGVNSYYQIGDGTQTNRGSPVLVAGGFSDWENISIQGWTWKYGIRSNGTLWCWGHVPLGVPSSVTYRSSPVQIGNQTDHAYGSSQPSYGAVYVGTSRNAAFILKNGNLISYNGYDSTRTTLYGSGSVVEYIHGSNINNLSNYTGNYIIKNVQY